MHFAKEDFEPQAFVFRPGTPHAQITLSSSHDDLTAPACTDRKPGSRRVGETVFFDLVEHNVRVLGGETDVDYTRYVIKPKKGNSYMELWFGPYALSTEPDDETLVNSTEFSQRQILAPGFGVVGTDSWGQLRTGEKWRQTAIAGGGGARYKATQPQDAALFDGIVSTMCVVPHEKESAATAPAEPKP